MKLKESIYQVDINKWITFGVNLKMAIKWLKNGRNYVNFIASEL